MADVSVHVRGDLVVHVTTDVDLTEVLARMTEMETAMGRLTDAVDAALAGEAQEDAESAAKDALIVELRAQLEQSQTDLTTALSNDAADAQTIADKQAEIDQLNADIDDQVARIEEAFPGPTTPEQPPVEPPVEEPAPPVDVPVEPAEGGTGDGG